MLDFQERFREALRRRLFPNASVHLKEIAGAIGRSENTVTRWWRGETRVNGEDLDRISSFFVRRGDQAFLEEVFGSAIGTGAAASSSILAARGNAEGSSKLGFCFARTASPVPWSPVQSRLAGGRWS